MALSAFVAASVVVGEHLVELLQAVRVEVLYGLPYRSVELFPLLLEQGVVGHLLGEGVLEDVLQFGEEALLVDELQAPAGRARELFSSSCIWVMACKQAVGKLAPDDRCHLHELS